MLLLIDGPEKAGKTTFIEHFIKTLRRAGIKWHVAHFRNNRPRNFDPEVYLYQLKVAARADTLVIMDRSWAAEVVYTQLLGRRPSWQAADFEWFMGNAVPTLGAQVMLVTHPDNVTLDDTDHPVDTESEIVAFLNYAHTWGWPVFNMGHDDDGESLRELNARVYEDVARAEQRISTGMIPRYVGGNPHAGVIVLGEGKAPGGPRGKVWLPFTSQTTAWMREVVPPPYTDYFYTNVDVLEENDYVHDYVMGNAHRVIALGRAAQRYVEEMRQVRPSLVSWNLPHPSAVVRWPRFAGYKDQYREVFRLAGEPPRREEEV